MSDERIFERVLYADITGKDAEGKLHHWALYKRLDELADGVEFFIDDTPAGWRPHQVRLRIMKL